MNKIEYREGFGIFMDVLVNGKPESRKCEIVIGENNPAQMPTPILREGERAVHTIGGEIQIISESA